MHSRAETRKVVSEPPKVWLELTEEFRPILRALEYRGDHSTGDPLLDMMIVAFPQLIRLIDNECLEYVRALTDRIRVLEEGLKR